MPITILNHLLQLQRMKYHMQTQYTVVFPNWGLGLSVFVCLFVFLRKWAQGKFSFALNCNLLSTIGPLALADEYQGRQRRTCNLCVILKSMVSLRQVPQRHCMCNKCRTQEKILSSCGIFNRQHLNNLVSEEHRSCWMEKYG